MNTGKAMVYTYYAEHDKRAKDKIMNLYNCFIKNKGKKYKEFVASICEDYKKMDIEEIKKAVCIMKKCYSVSKGEEMQYILLLAVSLEKNDQVNIEKYSKMLEEIENKKKLLKSNKSFSSMTNRKNVENNDKKLEKAKCIMEKVVNGEKLEESEKIDSNFNQYVKNNFKEFDKDFYLNYFIKVNNLKEVSKKEIDQLIEVMDYFLNATMKISESVSMIHKYFTNKVALDARINLYTGYRNMLIGLKEKNDFNSFKKVGSGYLKLMKKDYEFIKDFYDNISNIGKMKSTYVDGVLTNQKDLDELKEEFNKKILK